MHTGVWIAVSILLAAAQAADGGRVRQETSGDVPGARGGYRAGMELDCRGSLAADVPVDYFEFVLDPEYPELTSIDGFWKIVVSERLFDRHPERRTICGIYVPEYSRSLFQAQWLCIQAGLGPGTTDDPVALCNWVVQNPR